MVKLTGYSVDEIVGRNPSSFIVEEESEKGIPRFENLRDGINDRYELMARKKDGGYLWFIVSGSSLRDKDGNYMGSLAMFTDITERKRAEEALRQSEERLRTITQAAQVGFFDSDLVKGTVYWSPEMKAILGLPDDAAPVSPEIISS